MTIRSGEIRIVRDSEIVETIHMENLKDANEEINNKFDNIRQGNGGISSFKLSLSVKNELEISGIFLDHTNFSFKLDAKIFASDING